MELLTEPNCFTFTSSLVECFEVKENVQKLKHKRDWTKLWPKICFLTLSHPKYMAQTKEMQSNWTRLKKSNI